jgi:1-phosphofructokinase family hexose kinase
MSILVLALNPSIDVEWRVDRVQWEEKNVIQSERRWAGGKGVNVARWLRHLGCDSRLLLPLGGPTGDEMRRHLRGEKLPAQVVPLRESTRANAIVTTSDGRQLRFNPAGPKLSSREWNAVFRKTEEALPKPGCLILSGSLPRQAAPGVYARLARLARNTGCRVLVDCDGPAFTAAVSAHPFLVKPNEHELAGWLGRPLRTPKQLLRAAQDLSEATDGWVFVSRGRNGAILVNASEDCLLQAAAPRVATVNTVGAGDAMLAAVAQRVDQGAPPADWLRWGIATGSAATQCQAGKLAKLALLRRLAVTLPVSRSFL